jgi:hypothetical protein
LGLKGTLHDELIERRFVREAEADLAGADIGLNAGLLYPR